MKLIENKQIDGDKGKGEEKGKEIITKKQLISEKENDFAATTTTQRKEESTNYVGVLLYLLCADT